MHFSYENIKGYGERKKWSFLIANIYKKLSINIIVTQ